MALNNEDFLNDRDNHSNKESDKPNAWRVENNNNVKAQPVSATNSDPKPEKIERGNGENDRPHKGNTYQEETADGDNQTNIPGPNELPDQQKVGEEVDDDDWEHIET